MIVLSIDSTPVQSIDSPKSRFGENRLTSGSATKEKSCYSYESDSDSCVYLTCVLVESTFEVKNRVGDFFYESRDRVGQNRLESRTGTKGKRSCGYDFASGIPVFINPDPIQFAGGTNWYAFADGNPISYLDPFGLSDGSAGTWDSIKNFGSAYANTYLDAYQTGVGIAGMAPGIGNFADGLNAGISTLRGNYLDAAIDAGSCVCRYGSHTSA